MYYILNILRINHIYYYININTQNPQKYLPQNWILSSPAADIHKYYQYFHPASP